MRTIALLQLIPRHPKSVSTLELREALARQGFDINLRSLQRDLDGKLSQQFSLIRDETQRPYRWSFAAHTRAHSLPGLDIPAALALHLAEGHLRHLLPPGVLSHLSPQFEEAGRLLESLEENHLSRWARRVRALPNGKVLLPANVDPHVWERTATALLEQRQLQVDYLSRVKGELKHFVLHPKGLASRGPVTYLIASVGDYTDNRHFALHRIHRADVLDTQARDDDFDMDAYLPTAAFTPRQGTGTVELVADIHPDIAGLLRETPLSAEQRLENLPDTDWLRLTSCVPDDQETVWWAFGIGEKIRIRTPESWQQEAKRRLHGACALYAD